MVKTEAEEVLSSYCKEIEDKESCGQPLLFHY